MRLFPCILLSFCASVLIAQDHHNRFEHLRINFQPYVVTEDADIAPGYILDHGMVYGKRTAGLRFGWDRERRAVLKWELLAGDPNLATMVIARAGDRWHELVTKVHVTMAI